MSGAGEAPKVEYLGQVGRFHAWTIDGRKAFAEFRNPSLPGLVRWADTGKVVLELQHSDLRAFEERTAFAAAERAAQDGSRQQLSETND